MAQIFDPILGNIKTGWPITSSTIATGWLWKSQTLIAPQGSQRVSVEWVAPTYSAGISFTPVANPTDVFALISQTNSISTARIKRVSISGMSTVAGVIDVFLQKSPNGGGGTSVSCITGKHDAKDTNPAFLAQYFTANRTSGGNGVDSTRPLIRMGQLTFATTITNGVPIVWDFNQNDAKSPSITEITDWFVVNLNGQNMPAGATLSINIEWSEEFTVRVAFVGDSTTAVTTGGLMNGGANSGGIGIAGQINSIASSKNQGSNGYRIYDYLNNTNGVTYSLQAVQNNGFDAMIMCYGINDIRTGLCSQNQLIAMIDTAIYATLNGATTNQIYASSKATTFAISSLSGAGTTITATTTASHGWQVGGAVNVNIAGATPSGYNGFSAATITGTNTFTFTVGSNPGTATVMGTATYATKFASNIVATPDCKIILWGPNGFTADDGGDGPWHWLSSTNDTNLGGLWTGLTLAQAALAGSQLMYNAYQAFATDTRLFGFVQKQDLMMVSPADNITLVNVFPNKTYVTNVADSPTVGSNLKTMTNQLHPSNRGQLLELYQILPYLKAAITSASVKYF